MFVFHSKYASIYYYSEIQLQLHIGRKSLPTLVFGVPFSQIYSTTLDYKKQITDGQTERRNWCGIYAL